MVDKTQTLSQTKLNSYLIRLRPRLDSDLYLASMLS